MLGARLTSVRAKDRLEVKFETNINSQKNKVWMSIIRSILTYGHHSWNSPIRTDAKFLSIENKSLIRILGIKWQLQITRGPLQGNPTDRSRGISNLVRSIGQLQPRLIGEISVLWAVDTVPHFCCGPVAHFLGTNRSNFMLRLLTDWPTEHTVWH